NDIQETLVRLICRKDPGNVFRVGDIKQSIYGFRSAKPSLMKEILKNAEKDEKIVFHENFRSSDIIIRFNNIIYSTLMNIEGFSDTFSDEIDKASTILENKKANREKCEIHLLDLSVEGEKRPVREDRIDEAYYIVDRIRKMREVSQKRKEETKDEWSGLDEKKQKEWLYDHGIYADWKDYVILVRNHDHKTVMENAFRALDVPMFYIINKGYYDDVAVQTVISWLKWLNRIDDEIAMFSVLTSPFYEFSNNDLSRLVIDRRKENDGSRRYEYILKKYADIRDDYLHLKDIYEKKGLIVLLREIFSLHDFYYTKTTLQQRDDLALLYEKCNDVYERYPSIEDMLEWLAVNERADDGAATSISESSDVVRVITIHNSKGLEYPVVFYVASTLKAKGSEKGSYRLDETLGLSLEVYKTPYYLNYRPLLWQLIEGKHYREDIEEEIRLMYVATTRAMSKLIVVAFESQDKVRLTAAGIGKIAGKKEAVGNILREAIEANRPEIDKYCEVYHLTMNDMPQ
ncbi:MAG: UvrD-helicase domain-containing protein, partial [Erysipelotrichaceae bacterium]|nr:UvrD-helicase domain-containing protein [Erysipelotrichaceae bacterium]